MKIGNGILPCDCIPQGNRFFCPALLLDMMYQLFAAEVQAGKIKPVFPAEIVVEQPLVDTGFADIVYGASGISVSAEFVYGGFDNF